MSLDGKILGELTGLISDAFTQPEFGQLVRIRLNIDLATVVTGSGNWQQIAFDFVTYADRNERVTELLRAIRDARPGRAGLCEFCDRHAGPARPAAPGALRAAIEQFNEGFEVRNDLFKYVNAYKLLHDVLHELQALQPAVETAVRKRIEAPDQPLTEDIVLLLKDKLQTAAEAVNDVEFPEKPPRWIAKLNGIVDVFAGPDVRKLERELEKLQALPPEGLSAMNEKLFENASRLRPCQLIQSLNAIVEALGDGPAPAAAALRTKVEEFRNLCVDLDNLIRAHNLCQGIDDALHEFAGLPAFIPTEQAGWEAAKQSLQKLGEQRKNDLRVTLTANAARVFEAAGQGEAFKALLTCFTELFMATDKALLRVTNKMPPTALALHKALEKHL